MTSGLFALVSVLVFAVRFAREPRRVGNAVWFLIALGFTGLWLLTFFKHVEWAQIAIIVVVALVGGLGALALPWALIANGVVMLRREGRRLANLLSLLAGLGLLAVFALAVSSLVFDDQPLLRVAAMAVLFVTGYLAFLFTALLLYSILYSRVTRRASAGAVVVLGSGLQGDRVPPLLASRLDRAVQVQQRSPGALLVVSGGQGADELTSEADAMARYLRAAGVPADQIVREDRATATSENLRFSVALLEQRGFSGPILAVTNNYHVFRTAVLARQLGLRLNVIGAKTASYFVPSAFLREFVALLLQYRKTNAAVVLFLGVGPFLLFLIS
ncbi:YdcF family protein [Amycolatopsis echigonensis]|uniref:YdcF family protein n=1 Tax=Amycolatopsis echigonensis TaxID=2576905 RepID=A0A8E2B5G6_9PSEU|nr:YdcF family protein [Amycolatopsis echigonensis]MBB2500193.1 YdcF family protein [Amycolatopsis echigonensis]